MIATHGEDLALIWPRNHRRDLVCPGCGQSAARAGLNRLVYTFEECSCGTPEYTHLLEAIWHRQCLVASEVSR